MIIVKTPLRVSFAGGGSDLREYYAENPGLVVSTTIDKYVYITVNRRFDEEIRVSYSRTEIVRRVGDLKHNIVREAMKLLGVDGGIDIVYISDLPPAAVGTGLGASSAIAVGLLQALHAYNGEHVSPERLAEEACRLEIEVLRNPVGKQDQHAVAHGGFNQFTFYPDERVAVDPFVFPHGLTEKLRRKLLLFHTGIPSHSRVVLAEQRKKTRANRLHIDEIVSLAKELAGSLRRGRLDRFGEILHENWLHKRKLASRISNPLIDGYYEKALKAGAAGGKILGSGGGGFLLFYCDEDKQEKVRRSLAKLREMPFAFEPSGSRILYVSQ